MLRRECWVDLNQGVDKEGRHFGYVGCEYASIKGWFFTWKVLPIDATKADIADMLDTLDPEKVGVCESQIPHRFARSVLQRKLRSILP